jgi:hypothetical protein
MTSHLGYGFVGWCREEGGSWRAVSGADSKAEAENLASTWAKEEGLRIYSILSLPSGERPDARPTNRRGVR